MLLTSRGHSRDCPGRATEHRSSVAQALTVAAVLANTAPSTYLKGSWQPSGLEDGMAEFLAGAAAEAIAQWRQGAPDAAGDASS